MMTPPWLATLFVAGPSLAEAVATAGPLPPGPAWRLAVGLTEALAEIHGRGLVHRDLKPANVLLAIDGPRVIDFGISRALEATVMTETGLVVGTPSFMSPEQAIGGQVGPASDVFSLGCVIVFAATGAGPFGDGPVPSLLYRVVHAEPALGAVPAGLRELAAACLAKDPADRPALPQVLDAITAGAPPQAASLASFWPETVADLIRSHQARLDTQLAQPTNRDGGPAPVAQHRPPTGVPAPLQPPPDDRATGRPPATPGPAQSWDELTATGQPAAVLAVAAHGLAPDPVLPAELIRGDRARAPGPTVPPPPVERQAAGLTRRRALAGLAGAAAVGLAATGWELSQRTPTHTAQPPRLPRSGTEIWSSRAGGGPYFSPVITDGLVCYAGGPHGFQSGGPLYALRASDGAPVWSSAVGRGAVTFLATAGGVIFFGGNDTRLYALHATSGAQVWSTGIGGGPSTSLTLDGGSVYFGGADNTLYALHATSGARLWSTGIGGGPSGDVTVDGGVVYFGGNDSRLYALAASDGAPVWSTGTGGGTFAAPVVAGAVIYLKGNDRRLRALQAANGTELWSVAITGHQPFTGPAIAGGVIYFGAEDRLYAVRANNGARIWVTGAGRGTATDPVPTRGVVYVGGNDNRLYALRAADGTPTWSFGGGGAGLTDPVVTGGVVYLASIGNRLYALNA
jgi:outer membrane protein assembly factor BamB